MTALVYIMLCLVWGSTWIAIKLGLSEAGPFTTSALRFLVATSLLWGISLAKGYRYPHRLREIARLGYPGLFMYGLSYALVYFGQQYINTATSSVLFASYPFFVAAISWMMYRSDKLSMTAWAGMAVGFLGVVAISYDSLQTSGELFLGTMLLVASSVVSAYGIVVHKRHFNDVNIVVAANVQMIFGGALLLVGAFVFEDWSDFTVSALSIGSILYLAIPGTVVTFLGYYWLLRRVRLTVVSLVAFVTPLVAILIGVLLAEETLTPMIIAGAVMILSGMLFVIRK